MASAVESVARVTVKVSGWRTLGLFSGSLVLLLGWLYLFTPFKVTDPDDPRFDPMLFKFSDYCSIDIKGNVLPKLLKQGSDQSFVEGILVTSGGARRDVYSDNNSLIYYRWRYPLIEWRRYLTPDTHAQLAILYDNDGKLLALQIMNASVFNGEAIREIQQQQKRKLMPSLYKLHPQ